MGPTYSPQTMDVVGALYGDDYGHAGVVDMSAAPAPTARAAVTANPADRTDKGPSGWWEDPVVWLTLALAVGAGIIGFRFHFGPGAKASASVDLADELAEIVGTVFIAIAGIAAFKCFAARAKIPALQEFAAFL